MIVHGTDANKKQARNEMVNTLRDKNKSMQLVHQKMKDDGVVVLLILAFCWIRLGILGSCYLLVNAQTRLSALLSLSLFGRPRGMGQEL